MNPTRGHLTLETRSRDRAISLPRPDRQIDSPGPSFGQCLQSALNRTMQWRTSDTPWSRTKRRMLPALLSMLDAQVLRIASPHEPQYRPRATRAGDGDEARCSFAARLLRPRSHWPGAIV